MKKRVKLTESDLHRIVRETVDNILCEVMSPEQKEKSALIKGNKPSNYIVVYNGIPFPVNSIEEAAFSLFGLKVELSDNGRDWDIIVNGESRAHYLCTGVDDNKGTSSMDNGYTKDEALRDYMRNFVGKNTYSNLHWYQLVENSK